jgi:membrane carboxypeptidase/penicillin-binding protein PbpC
MDDPLAGSRPAFAPSVRIEDRHGRLLREVLSEQDTRSEWRPLSAMSPCLVQAALAAEDPASTSTRHRSAAVVRAAWLNLKNRRISAEPSTTTMQLRAPWIPVPRSLTASCARPPSPAPGNIPFQD